MKEASTVEVIQLFFLDFVGLLVPGAALIVGSQAMFGWLPSSSSVQLLPPDGFGWAVLLVGGYVLGHAVNGIGTGVVTPILSFLRIGRRESELWTQIREKEGFNTVVNQRKLGAVPKHDADNKEGTSRTHFLAKRKKTKEMERKVLRYCHSARSVAMTLVSERDRQLIQKFRFIALLNQGAATVLVVLVLLAAAIGLLNTLGWVATWGNSPRWFWVAAVILVPAFASQQSDFYRRSLGVCFDMAQAILVNDGKTQLSQESESTNHPK